MSVAFIELMKSHSNALSVDEAKKIYLEMPESYKSFVLESTLVDYLTSQFKQNILWHDYEAGGTHAPSVPPLQFAGIRTDLEHRILDEPIDMYCQLPGDKLPHPVAIKITQISPLHCYDNGIPEPLFFKIIESEMSIGSSCVAGYNSLGYDDEITRFGFWRNLLPVYDRESRNNCSKWDLLNVVAAFFNFSHDSIVWPKVDDKYTLKLENLAKANGITQDNAHNAVDDVKALIELSSRLKKSNPELWNYLYDSRSKNELKGKFAKGNIGYITTAQSGSDSDFHTPILLLGALEKEPNKWVALKLNDLDIVRGHYHTTTEKMAKLLYSKKEELELLGEERPPLLTIAINKCPAFFPIDWVKENKSDFKVFNEIETVEKISLDECFISRLVNVYNKDWDNSTDVDPELALYMSGFPSYKDKSSMGKLKSSSISEAFNTPIDWDNPIYGVLWQRARCKLDGFYDINVSDEEMSKWHIHCDIMRNANIDINSKHKNVNMSTLPLELEVSCLPENLRSDYLSWLSTITKV